jgi:hypothetical protein
LRQRANKKAGASMISLPASSDVPQIPNPDGRVWHPLTLEDWAVWWASEMSTKWLPADVGGLAQLAVLVDEFYKGDTKLAAEIRLQRQCFGLTPLDRSRLQWEIAKVEEGERKQQQRAPKRTGTDPRFTLMAVK